MSTRGSFGRSPGAEREREKWESKTGKGRLPIQGVLKVSYRCGHQGFMLLGTSGRLGGPLGHASQVLRHLGIYSPTPHCLRATSKDNNSLTCFAVFLWPEKALRQRAAGAVGSQRVCMHQWAALRGHRWGTGSTFFKGPT